MDAANSNTGLAGLSDAELEAVDGGLRLCAFGYCATISTDGVSVGPKGGSHTTQELIDAFKAGIQKGLHSA